MLNYFGSRAASQRVPTTRGSAQFALHLKSSNAAVRRVIFSVERMRMISAFCANMSIDRTGAPVFLDWGIGQHTWKR